MSDTPDLAMLSAWLKVLAEPRRLQIFDLLMEGVQCNCELSARLDLAPNLISHHLAALRRAGLIAVRRNPTDARWLYFSVNPDALAALNGALARFLDPQRLSSRAPACDMESVGALERWSVETNDIGRTVESKK